MNAKPVTMSVAPITVDSLRRCYPLLLGRDEAQQLCRTLNVGSHVFKRWCRQSPVGGEAIRVQLPGYKKFHYRREVILAACGLIALSV